MTRDPKRLRGGIPNSPGGDPKMTRDPKKGSQISGASPGQVLGKGRDPKFGIPIFWDPSILGSLPILGSLLLAPQAKKNSENSYTRCK